jgi:type I restriction enzyme S subunit
VPNGWRAGCVKELARVVGGGTPDRSRQEYWRDGTVPWVTPTDLTAQSRKYILDTGEHITDRGYEESSARLLPKGTVICSSRGTVGTLAIAGRPLATNQSCENLIPRDGVDSEFLYYLMHHVRPMLERLACGTTFQSVTRDDIACVRVAYPRPAEQAAIARTLDAADEAIARSRTALEKARRVKRALMQRLLTRGACAGRKMVASRFGRFPTDWRIMKLAEVAEVGSGVTLGKDLNGYATVELPYLRVANVQDGHLDLSEIKTVRVKRDEAGQYMLKAGDVLMTEGGDIDKLGRGTVWNGEIADCLHQNHVFRVRANRESLVPAYLAAVIGAEYGKRYFMRVAKRTTNLASTNKTQVRAFPLPVPPVDEQRQIVAILMAAQQRVAAEDVRLQMLERLKRGLMQGLLTGRVRPMGVGDARHVDYVEGGKSR